MRNFDPSSPDAPESSASPASSSPGRVAAAQPGRGANAFAIPRFVRQEYGEYVLHDRIGSGGMAEIFLATSRGIEGFEKRLVIKRILPTLSDDEQFVRMFIEEAKLCVALKHPNIVQVYDLGEIDHQYYIAMEYVDGRDLLKTLAACGRKRIGFPTDIALYIVMEVLRGLDHAHGLTRPDGQPLGIIHRDVSPSNVLLSFEGEVKIGDFGIAKASTREKTATGILKGKFGYMAPEQVTGSPIDHRADVFAAGIVLFELLTGHRLFAGKNDLAVLERVRDAIVDPPARHYRPDLDPQLERIVDRALARRVQDRFQTARELHDALHEYVHRSRAQVGPAHLARFMQNLFLHDPEEQARRARVRLPPVEPPAAHAFRATSLPPRPREAHPAPQARSAREAHPTPQARPAPQARSAPQARPAREGPSEAGTMVSELEVRPESARSPSLPTEVPSAITEGAVEPGDRAGADPAIEEEPVTAIRESPAPRARSSLITASEDVRLVAPTADPTGDAGFSPADIVERAAAAEHEAPPTTAEPRPRALAFGPLDTLLEAPTGSRLEELDETGDITIRAPDDEAGLLTIQDPGEPRDDDLTVQGDDGSALDPEDRAELAAVIADAPGPSSTTDVGDEPIDLPTAELPEVELRALRADLEPHVVERGSHRRGPAEAADFSDGETTSGFDEPMERTASFEGQPEPVVAPVEEEGEATLDGLDRPDPANRTTSWASYVGEIPRRGSSAPRGGPRRSSSGESGPSRSSSGESGPSRSSSGQSGPRRSSSGQSEPRRRPPRAEASLPGRAATTFGELVDEAEAALASGEEDPDATMGLPSLEELEEDAPDAPALTSAGALGDEGASGLFGVLSVLDDEESSSSFGDDELTGETESRSVGGIIDPSIEDDPSVEYDDTRLGALTNEERAYLGPLENVPRRGREKTPTANVSDAQVESVVRAPPADAPLFDIGVAEDPSERVSPSRHEAGSSETMDELEEPSGLLSYEAGSELGFASAPVDDPTAEGPELEPGPRRAPERLLSSSFEIDPTPLLEEPGSESGSLASRRQRDALRRAAGRARRPVKEMNRSRHVDTRTGAIELPADAPGAWEETAAPPPPAERRTSIRTLALVAAAVCLLVTSVLGLAWAYGTFASSKETEATALAPLPETAPGSAAPEDSKPAERDDPSGPGAADSRRELTGPPQALKSPEPARTEAPSAAESTTPLAAGSTGPGPDESTTPGAPGSPGPAPAPSPSSAESAAPRRAEASAPSPDEAPKPSRAEPPRSKRRRSARRSRRRSTSAAPGGGVLALECETPADLHIRGQGRVAVTAGRFEKRLPVGGYVVTLVREGRILDRRSVRLLAGGRVDLPCP